MAEYTINELVSLSGCNRRNVHFYVQQGLLPPPQGAGLGARYGDEHLRRLRAIPLLRSQGLRLDEIRELLAGAGADSIKTTVVGIPRASPPSTPPRCPPMPDPIRIEAQHLVRYTLAPGIELLVDSPGSASSAQVEELIQSARKIFQSDSHHIGGKL